MLDLGPLLATVFPSSPGPYVALMLFGFVFGILGHLMRVRWLIASGVILIFLGALLFPLAATLTTDDDRAPREEIVPLEETG